MHGDPRLTWSVFGVLALAAIAIAAVGVARLLVPYRMIQGRLAAFDDLPLMRGIATTQARLEETREAFSHLDEYLARAESALESIQRSLESLRASFAPALVSFALAAENLRVLRAAFASRSKGT